MTTTLADIVVSSTPVASSNGLIHLLIVIAVIGVIAWALTLLPMPAPFKTIIIVLAALFALLIGLNALGVY